MSGIDSNELGQPLGRPLPGWIPRQLPPAHPMSGRWCRLERLDPGRHGEELYRAYAADGDGRMWTYLPWGPFPDLDRHLAWVEEIARSEDPLFFAVVDQASERPTGLAAFLRMDPANGCLEVGGLAFGPALQRTTAATEAMALMMARAFDELGYRRYEWKCDALNEPSRRAAERLGFRYEGTFRQARVVKGRNRDTAWFSVTDLEWPRLRVAHRRWLDPGNFDREGRQRLSLSELTGPGNETT